MPTTLSIGIDRIGTALDTPAVVPICQIGGSRIGMPCTPRDKTGRFVSLRTLAEVSPLEVSAAPEPETQAPQRVRAHPLVKLIAILCVLAACGAWRISTPFALSLLQVSGPVATEALLHIAQFTPGEFQIAAQHPYASACRWRARQGGVL